MCPVWNGFPDTDTSLYSSLDLAPNIILPSFKWISVNRQSAIVTVDNDIVEVLWKMTHIFTHVEYAVLTWVAKCTDADNDISENVLY
jgi:hypothetical protein